MILTTTQKTYVNILVASMQFYEVLDLHCMLPSFFQAYNFNNTVPMNK